VTDTALGYIHEFQPATAKGLPTLLLLHGTGGDEHDLLPLGRMLAPGAALLSPRGNVLEREMARFFRRFAEGVFDEEDVKRRAAELAAFVAAAAKEYGFAAENVVAAGFSNGANIAGAVMLLHPEVLRGGILLRAQGVLAAPPAAPVAGDRHAFLSAGESDPIVTPGETEKLAAALRTAGARVTLHWEAAGHIITRGDIAAARDWLAALPSRS